jgi:hypothetical protein
MPISRRGFLGRAAGASAAGVAAAAGLANLFPQTPVLHSGCVVVDPGPNCPLRESAAGYEAALSSLNVAFQRTSLQPLGAARLIIFPAAVSTAPSSLAHAREHLENGSVVLYESGSAFLSSGEFGFHKRVIRSVFGLSLHDPVGLWDSADSFKQSPYVDFHWPVVTKVREFSRAVPVEPENGKAIAWFQNLSVAVKRRVGKGTLVFLGSPLGPHLLASDREASRWLGALYCSC